MKKAENLLVCTATDFTIYNKANAARIRDALRFKLKGVKDNSIQRLSITLISILSSPELKWPEDETRELYDAFCKSLVKGGHCFLLFSVDVQWAAANIEAFQMVLQRMNEGMGNEDAIREVNAILKERNEQTLAKMEEEKAVAAADGEVDDHNQDIYLKEGQR